MPAFVTIPLRDHGQLSGRTALTGTTDCIVYVHGFGSDVRGEKPTAVFSACARRDWSCAAFDFRGHGQSSGTMRDLRASGLQSDLESVCDYLRSQGVKQFYLVGSSMGGFASAWFARDHPEVKAVVLLAPAFRFLQRRWDSLTEEQRREWRETKTLRYRNQWLDVELDIDLVDEAGTFDPDTLADTWRTPALIFHGLQDETVPWLDTLALVERAPFPGIELRLLKDGDHRLQAYREVMAEESCRFFARWFAV